MKKITIRFDNDAEHIYEAIKKIAKRNRRSLNGEILQALLAYVQLNGLADGSLQARIKEKRSKAK